MKTLEKLVKIHAFEAKLAGIHFMLSKQERKLCFPSHFNNAAPTPPLNDSSSLSRDAI